MNTSLGAPVRAITATLEGIAVRCKERFSHPLVVKRDKRSESNPFYESYFYIVEEVKGRRFGIFGKVEERQILTVSLSLYDRTTMKQILSCIVHDYAIIDAVKDALKEHTEKTGGVAKVGAVYIYPPPAPSHDAENPAIENEVKIEDNGKKEIGHKHVARAKRTAAPDPQTATSPTMLSSREALQRARAPVIDLRAIATRRAKLA